MSEIPTTGARITTAGFIGRASELAALEAALADARSAIPRLVLLTGESGVGKSRLLSEFRARLDELGAASLGGECIDLGEDELPYAALVGALRPLARSGDPALTELEHFHRCELALLAPELGEAPERGGREGEGDAQRHLFDSLLALIERMSVDRPLVFWLEDVHWADRSTRAFISFLARSLREERVLFLLTLRSDELHRRHPMRPLLAELVRLPLAQTVDIARFSPGEVQEQLASILGGEPASGLVERMYSRSEGNPLFTEQLLAGGLDGRASLPPTLSDALLLRLEAVAPETSNMLRILAVTERLDEDALSMATGLEPTALREAVREAFAANVLEARPDGDFRFRHALLREALYDDLLPGERADDHLAVARALEGVDRPMSVGRSAAIAHHYNAAGCQEDALRTAVRAAEEAQKVHADAEAASLVERALALWPRAENPEELVGFDYPGMLEWAGRASFYAAEDARAVALYQQAIDAMGEDAEPVRLGVVLGLMSRSEWILGHAERSNEALGRALDLVSDDTPVERAELLAYQVRAYLLQGRFADVVDSAADALRSVETAEAANLGRPAGLALTRASVLNWLGTAHLSLGDRELGERHMDESIAIAEKFDLNDALGTSYSNYADSLALLGQTERAMEIGRRGFGLVRPGSRPHRWLGLQLADLSFMLGDWDEAASLLRSGADLHGTFKVCFDLFAGQLAIARDDLGAARTMLDDAGEILRGAVEPQYISSLCAQRVALELRSGEIDAARRVVDDSMDQLEFCTEDELRFVISAGAGVAVEAAAAERARDLGDDPTLELALAGADRMLRRADAAAEEQMSNPLVVALARQARADHARAHVAPDGAERWREAATAWQDISRPYRVALAHWREAEAELAAGDREAAASAARSAEAIAATLSGAWLQDEIASLIARARLRPAPSGDRRRAPAADENPFGLTERELQVIGLLAEGMTNREISERLFMAEKTASVHVSRILSKLEVKSRTEAAAVAHRRGLAISAPGEAAD